MMRKNLIWKVASELGLEGFRRVDTGTNDFLNDQWQRGLKVGGYGKFL